MDRNKLKQLLKSEEGPKLDFKASLSLYTEGEKKELTKDVIAMANSRGGRGYIVFGVEDKTKRILGIHTADFHEEQIQQIVTNRCDPPIPISVDFFEVEGKNVAVLTVFRSSHQPHQMLNSGAFYIRRGSTTDVARRGEIANLLQENGLMTYETVIVKNAGVEELDMDLIRQFFARLNIQSEKPSEVVLEALGFIGSRGEGEGYRATVGGLLLFGKNPSLFLPHIYIKVVRQEEIRYVYGNVPTLLDNAVDCIREMMEDAEYPYRAVEEVIANALVHRDYLDTSRGIVVTITDRNLEISNPGSLVSGNSVYKVVSENNPDRRNAWLYQRLVTADGGRRFLKSGVGLTRVKKAFEGIGEVKLLNIGSQNLFKVILPRMRK